LIQIHQRYSIPPTSQRFIIGRVWPKDSDILSRCGLMMDNAELFVYIMSSTANIAPTVSIPLATITMASAGNGLSLANHINGHTCGTLFILSVCLLYVCSGCIVAKWYVLLENCLKKQIGLCDRCLNFQMGVPPAPKYLAVSHLLEIFLGRDRKFIFATYASKLEVTFTFAGLWMQAMWFAFHSDSWSSCSVVELESKNVAPKICIYKVV